MPPRMGVERVRRVSGGRLRELMDGDAGAVVFVVPLLREGEGNRWRPACVRRKELTGREVRRERSCWRVARVVDDGRLIGIAKEQSS